MSEWMAEIGTKCSFAGCHPATQAAEELGAG